MLSGSADYFDNVMTKFMFNNKIDALKTDINLFFTTRRMNFKFMCPRIDHKNEPMSAREFLQIS